MHTTYNDLSVKLTGTLQGCDACAQSKAKARAVRKYLYKSVTARRKDFVDTNSPIPESFIGNC